MLRFSIRDVLRLTVVVGLGTALWISWLTLPRMAKQTAGSICVSGQPVMEGSICLHSTDGQIVGARITRGKFDIRHVPAGNYTVTIEGIGVAAKYGDDKSPLTLRVKEGLNTFDFNLR